ncbi:MAG: glycosyltransferase [Rhodobacteraceae bacterium]|nr:glycosyltransferase [Paracoccaceae bacterium]
MKIFGHCRFSYFGLSDTGRAIKNLEHAQRLLWNPQRMAVRFHLFEHLLLPALAGQTNPDFTMVITSSAAMPDIYHERLERLTRAVPQIRLLRTEAPTIADALLPILREASDDQTNPSVHFRVDDDDAISTDYVARLPNAAWRVDPGGMISFPNGVIGFIDQGVAKHAPHHMPDIAIGLALVNAPDSRQDPFSIQHRRHGRRVPGYRDPTHPSFHYTLHLANNTSGYREDGQILPPEVTNPRVQITYQLFPELAKDQVAAPPADDWIAAAFPYTSGPDLRRNLERAGNPLALAEEMGFPLP